MNINLIHGLKVMIEMWNLVLDSIEYHFIDPEDSKVWNEKRFNPKSRFFIGTKEELKEYIRNK